MVAMGKSDQLLDEETSSHRDIARGPSRSVTAMLVIHKPDLQATSIGDGKWEIPVLPFAVRYSGRLELSIGCRIAIIATARVATRQGCGGRGAGHHLGRDSLPRRHVRKAWAMLHGGLDRVNHTGWHDMMVAASALVIDHRGPRMLLGSWIREVSCGGRGEFHGPARHTSSDGGSPSGTPGVGAAPRDGDEDPRTKDSTPDKRPYRLWGQERAFE